MGLKAAPDLYIIYEISIYFVIICMSFLQYIWYKDVYFITLIYLISILNNDLSILQYVYASESFASF